MVAANELNSLRGGALSFLSQLFEQADGVPRTSQSAIGIEKFSLVLVFFELGKDEVNGFSFEHCHVFEFRNVDSMRFGVKTLALLQIYMPK